MVSQMVRGRGRMVSQMVRGRGRMVSQMVRGCGRMVSQILFLTEQLCTTSHSQSLRKTLWREFPHGQRINWNCDCPATFVCRRDVQYNKIAPAGLHPRQELMNLEPVDIAPHHINDSQL